MVLREDKIMFNNNYNGMQLGNLNVGNLLERLRQIDAIRAFQNWMNQQPRVYDTMAPAQRYGNSAQSQMDRMQGYRTF